MNALYAPYGNSALSGKVTINELAAAKLAGEKWPMLTSYDAMTAALFDAAGIPVLLVGDSAAMVVFGHDNTLPVTLEELLPLVQAVARGARRALVVADLPFGTYQESTEQALATAIRFIKEGQANAVKLEGGRAMVPQIEALVAAGIPVMAHVGLTPQSVNQLGGYKVQGRDESSAEALLQDALAVEAAGAFAVVVEVVPDALGKRISEALRIPVIGIGAGAHTDAQVLVWQDLLGLTPGKTAKFVRKYAQLHDVITDAVTTWADDVRSGNYPAESETYG